MVTEITASASTLIREEPTFVTDGSQRSYPYVTLISANRLRPREGEHDVSGESIERRRESKEAAFLIWNELSGPAPIRGSLLTRLEAILLKQGVDDDVSKLVLGHLRTEANRLQPSPSRHQYDLLIAIVARLGIGTADEIGPLEPAEAVVSEVIAMAKVAVRVRGQLDVDRSLRRLALLVGLNDDEAHAWLIDEVFNQLSTVEGRVDTMADGDILDAARSSAAARFAVSAACSHRAAVAESMDVSKAWSHATRVLLNPYRAIRDSGVVSEGKSDLERDVFARLEDSGASVPASLVLAFVRKANSEKKLALRRRPCRVIPTDPDKINKITQGRYDDDEPPILGGERQEEADSALAMIARLRFAAEALGDSAQSRRVASMLAVLHLCSLLLGPSADEWLKTHYLPEELGDEEHLVFWAAGLAANPHRYGRHGSGARSSVQRTGLSRDVAYLRTIMPTLAPEVHS